MKFNKLLHIILYFFLSAILTWLFIILCPVYVSTRQMLLSTAIAGGKWMIQIVLGLALLKDKSFIFLKKIGLVCFTGSVLLIPYILTASLKISNSSEFFFGSLIAAVIAMIILYYKAVKQIEITIIWWWFWLICLATAIFLQLTIVFEHVKI